MEEDVDMDMHTAGPFLCRECTNGPRKETVYCSLRCADMNFQSHRETVHVPERKQRGLNVDQDMVDLEFDRENRGRYRAREIRVHLAPLGDMLVDFQQRHEIEVTDNGYAE